ncbi:MAG: hypothetical protein V9H69_11210 [Anaerolineae bacterium]
MVAHLAGDRVVLKGEDPHRQDATAPLHQRLAGDHRGGRVEGIHAVDRRIGLVDHRHRAGQRHQILRSDRPAQVEVGDGHGGHRHLLGQDVTAQRFIGQLPAAGERQIEGYAMQRQERRAGRGVHHETRRLDSSRNQAIFRRLNPSAQLARLASSFDRRGRPSSQHQHADRQQSSKYSHSCPHSCEFRRPALDPSLIVHVRIVAEVSGAETQNPTLQTISTA